MHVVCFPQFTRVGVDWCISIEILAKGVSFDGVSFAGLSSFIIVFMTLLLVLNDRLIPWRRSSWISVFYHPHPLQSPTSFTLKILSHCSDWMMIERVARVTEIEPTPYIFNVWTNKRLDTCAISYRHSYISGAVPIFSLPLNFHQV